jgi:hypothetical protein
VNTQTTGIQSFTVRLFNFQALPSDSTELCTTQAPGYKASPESMWKAPLASTNGNAWMTRETRLNAPVFAKEINN